MNNLPTSSVLPVNNNTDRYVTVQHPVHGLLRQVAVTDDSLIELYQDESGLMYLYYNNRLRLTINPQFWMQAELSIVQYDESVQILSSGQPVFNIPLAIGLMLQDEHFDSVIDGD